MGALVLTGKEVALCTAMLLNVSADKRAPQISQTMTHQYLLGEGGNGKPRDFQIPKEGVSEGQNEQCHRPETTGIAVAGGVSAPPPLSPV